MIPENSLSAQPMDSVYLTPDNFGIGPLIDYEQGGIALNDASQGLNVRPWSCFIGENGSDVVLQAEDDPPVTIFTQNGIEALSFCFDQNMRPCVAYVIGVTVYLRWFDSVPSAYVTTNFGSAIRDPRVCLDDKRDTQFALKSDIIFAYLKGDSLCFRQQRDRFNVEYVLETGLSTNIRLKNVGMTKGLRLQFELL